MPAPAAKPQIERRFNLAGATLRAEPIDGKTLPRLAGVACPWDALSVVLWQDWDTGKPVYERFVRGAFAEDLATNPDVIVPRDHDPSLLLGRTASGTAAVFEGDTGLEYWVDPPDTEDGRTVVTLVGRGDIRGSSFAFIASTVDWTEEEDRVIRTVRKARLFDVSPVTNPAYPDSTATMSRSIEAMQAELRTWRADPNAWSAALRDREASLVAADL